MQDLTPVDVPSAAGDPGSPDPAGACLPEASVASQLSDAPLIAPSQLAADTTDPSSHPETSFHAGDLVEIDRNGVNCRAWMSRLAPVRCKLQRGTRATLLGDPYHFGRYEWVKVRVHESDIEGCLSTRYLDPVQPASVPGGTTGGPLDAAVAPVASQQADALITHVNLKLRGGPGVEHPVVGSIAANTLGSIVDAPITRGDMTWLPVRVREASGWIAARHTITFASTGKWIEVDLATQRLTAWQNGESIRQFVISSGKHHFSTPVGAYTIRKKIPVRVLSGSVRGEDWKIPGVPWIMVFRSGGFYIHAVYWHNDFGQPVSHGCVTLAPDDAEWLYAWTPLDTCLWIHV